MKKFLSLLLVVCILLGILPAAALADDTSSDLTTDLNILYIGNSYTGDAVDSSSTGSQTWRIFHDLLGDSVNLTIGCVTDSGRTLAWHASRDADADPVENFSVTTDGSWHSQGTVTLTTAMNYTDWDIVILQPYMVEAWTGTAVIELPDMGYDFDEYYAPMTVSIPYLLNLIQETNSDPTVYYYMHWARTSVTSSISAVQTDTTTGDDNIYKLIEVAESIRDLTSADYVPNPAGMIKDGTATTDSDDDEDDDTESESEEDLDTETDTESDTSSDTGSDTDSDSDTGSESDEDLDTDSSTESDAELDTDSDADDDSDSDTDSNTDSGSEEIGAMPAEYTEIAKKSVAAAINNPTSITTISGYETDPAVAAAALAPDATASLTIESEDTDSLEYAIVSALTDAASSSSTISDLALDDLKISVEVDSMGDGEYTASLSLQFGYTFKDVDLSGTYEIYEEPEETETQDVTSSTSSSKSSSRSSSSSSGTDTKSDIEVDSSSTENGSVSLSSSTAVKGKTVTITVTPDEGYVLDTLTVLDEDGDEVDVTDNGDGTYSFTMPKGDVTITATFVEEDEESDSESASDSILTDVVFDDVVDASSWYYNAVYWAASEGITTGTTADLFSPDQTITRKELVTMLWRLAGEPAVTGTDTAFVDIYGSQYTDYQSAILWAESIGLTTGKGSTYTFCPDDTVTRAEIVTFLQRYDTLVAGGDTVTALVSFEFVDVADPDDWYYASVYWAYENGITEGNSAYAFTFGPDDACTRAEFVTFLYRYAA